MSTDTSKKKKKNKRGFSNRHGIVLIALLAVMILVVNLVAFSYSWFTPVTVSGQGLAMEENASLRSERCTFQTFPGVLVTESNRSQYQGYYIDQVAYADDPIAENAVIVVPRATVAYDENNEEVIVPGRVYFRTEIQNTDTNYPSVISLYHHEMPAELGVAITDPSNTYHMTEEDYTDYFIVRNAYVKVKDDADVDGPGLLPVEWFVENRDTTTTKEIRVTRQTKAGSTRTATSISWLYNADSGAALSTPIEWLYLMYN